MNMPYLPNNDALGRTALRGAWAVRLADILREMDSCGESREAGCHIQWAIDLLDDGAADQASDMELASIDNVAARLGYHDDSAA